MRYDEIINKYKGGSTSQPKTYSSSKSYDSIISKYKTNTTASDTKTEGSVPSFDTSFAEEYIQSATKFMEDATSGYNSLTWGNAADSYAALKPQYTDIYRKTKEMRKWIEDNYDSLSGSQYVNLRDFVDQVSYNSVEITRAYQDAVKHFEQWETEEAYNRDFTNAKRLDELNSTVDFDDFEEIAELGSTKAKDIANANIEKRKQEAQEREDMNWLEKSWDTVKDTYNAGKYILSGDFNEDISGAMNKTQLTDEERKIYNYYIGKGDMDTAQEYLDLLDNDLKQRLAGKMAGAVEGFGGENSNIAKITEVFFSTAAGVHGFLEGTANIGKMITGKDVGTSSAIARAYAQTSSNNTGMFKFANDLAYTTGNMLPSILTSTYLSGALGGTQAAIKAGQIAGTTLMGTSAAGNAYAEMRNLGYEDWQAAAYGTLVGASEALLQNAIGGISKLGGKYSIASIAEKYLPAIDNAFARFAISYGGKMASEGVEESIQTGLEPVFRWMVTGDYDGVEVEEAVYSALLGMASAGLLEGAGTVKNEVSRSNFGKSLDPSSLVNEGLELAEGTDARKLADKYNSQLLSGKNLNGTKMANLYEAVESQETKDDTQKLKKSILKRLGDLGETSDVTPIAEALVRYATSENGDLSLRDIKILDKSKAGYLVLTEMNKGNIDRGSLANKWAEKIGTKRVSPEYYGVENATKQLANNMIRKLPIVVDTEYEVSKNGKTYYTNTDGERVKANIKKLVSKGDQIQAELSNGDVVSLKSIQYASSEQAAIYETVSSMNISAQDANAIINAVKTDSSRKPSSYYSSLQLAYRYGELNRAEGLKNLSLPENIKQFVYDLGKSNAKTTEVKSNESKSISVRDGGERSGSENSEGQVSSMESGAGQDQTGTEAESGIVADRKAARLVNKGREVKISDLGIEGASDTDTVRIIEGENETDSMKEARRLAEERGLKVTFFVGGNLIITEKGKTISARGYISTDSKQVFVRADHALYTAEQLMKHEIGHDMIDNGEISVDDVRERLKKIVSAKNVDALAAIYAAAYEGSGLEYDDIWEELICDSVADMNVFAGSVVGALGDIVTPQIKEKALSSAKAPTKSNEAKGGRMSIDLTENGSPVVVVKDDITRYASNDKVLVKLVKESIGRLPYVALGKQKIKFMRDTKNEVTYSQYTKWLRKNHPDLYKDKMRLFNHPSEIVLATTNYVNEGLTHSRKDNLIDFARGEVLVDILNKQYAAEVVIGFTKQGECELHDVVNITPTTFKYKKRDALSTLPHNGGHLQKRSSLVSSIPQNPNLSIASSKKVSNGHKSFDSIAYSFFGDKSVTISDFENLSYKDSDGYHNYVTQCLSNMRQTIEGFNSETALKEIESSIDGIVKVAVAMKKAGYDILDNRQKRETTDSKGRLLFSSLEPNSDYFTSSDISTICDKRINFADIYDEIVRREEEMGVPVNKRFFNNVDNYFVLHKILADKGLTQPCRQCYVESMRKNLAPMANAFLKLVQETDINNKSNDQLYQLSGKNKGELKSNNAKLRENVLEVFQNEDYDLTLNDLSVEMLTTEDGLAQLKIQAPLIYEAFNSFYGQSKPKMPKSATPFRFGELTALLIDEHGKVKKSLVEKIKSTGGFRLQSYSDFQIQNFADVLQVIFEAGTLGLNGHAYTKVPAFLDATKGTNLKRNISIFMYNDGGVWKIDRNDSFPYTLEEIYNLVESDKSGNTGIIAVSQNEDMSAWIMANDNIGYFIPFHKSGMKMGTVRETIVKEGGREIKGYENIKDHTRQQTEVWAFANADHKAYTKVKKSINIYDFWDFSNPDNLSKNKLIEKNVKAYINACEVAGYLPKFREYVMNNGKVLNNVLKYSKELGFVSEDATIEDISFEYKGYVIPYGYYKCLGDFGMFKPNGKASPIERLSLSKYNFDEAVKFFTDAETVRRNEILQQIANGTEREKYRNSDMSTAEISEIVQSKRKEVVEDVLSGKASRELDFVDFVNKNSDGVEAVTNRTLLANALESDTINDVERQNLKKYKDNIALIEAEEAKLNANKAEAKKLRFKKGRTAEETARLRKLDAEANALKNNINTYDKRLLRLESAEALCGVLEREKEKVRKKAMAKGKEMLERYRESGEKGELRRKIKGIKRDLETSLLRATDNKYVPSQLVESIIDVVNLINTDTDLFKKDGSINKSQAKREDTKEKLLALKEAYSKLKEADSIYQGEFDEFILEDLDHMREQFKNRPLNDLDIDELRDMYYTLRSISDSLIDARKLIGFGEKVDVYEAGDAIIAEQGKIRSKRKRDRRTAAGKTNDGMANLTLAPVRNVERMSAYDEKSYLVRLFKEFEKGVRKKNKFYMDAHRAFEELVYNKENAKKYDEAMYTTLDKEYTDVKGRKFKVTKMQIMQAILSFERESADTSLNHISKGGFTFADSSKLKSGNIKAAISSEYSHTVVFTPEMVNDFMSAIANDSWAQAYMEEARKFFNETAKDAINETMLQLKHRIVAKSENYIPFEVDKHFVSMEISAENNIQQTINSYGMLKETVNNATQPLIITGLNNVIERHINLVSNVYGLAIPVRNFNKVWNVRNGATSVRDIIETNWGEGGVKSIEQAVKDIQGPRVTENDVFDKVYQKIKSGVVSATFLLNLSVVTKQIGSMYSARSMISYRNAASMMINLANTMLHHKAIAEEVDKYTASAWMRRQGLSDAELANFMSEGHKLLKLNKLPTVLNPGKWISAMDYGVALSLWKYCKEDVAKRTGLEGEELLKATAEFYDSVIENTQSMSDVLHRPEIQKKKHNPFADALSMFKTDLYQTAGQIRVAFGRFANEKSKENAAFLGKTLYSALSSSLWGALMTSLFAALRYKVNQYRDDEEDVTLWSWMSQSLFDISGDLVGYMLPMFGGELVNFIENIKDGNYNDEFFDSIALSTANDLVNSISTIASKGFDLTASDYIGIATKMLQLFGVPASNIKRLVDSVRLHTEDILNGEFFSFEAGADRTAKQYMVKVTDAIDSNDMTDAKEMFEKATLKLGNNAKTRLKTALGTLYKDGDISKEEAELILKECFDITDEDDIYWQFDRWDYAIENGTSDDYSKMGDFYEAVRTGKDLKAVINRYVENGVEKKTLAQQITTHFKPIYLESTKVERANLKGYLVNAYVLLGYDRAKKSKDIDAWLEE